MQIEIHLPSGLLYVVKPFSPNYQIARTGDGRTHLIKKKTCIPHSTMCGPFSRDPAIAAQCQVFSNAISFRNADYWSSKYIRQHGVIKP